MAMPPSDTFKCQAEFDDHSFRGSETDLQGHIASEYKETRLVGLNPKIRFCYERLVLIAAGRDQAKVQDFSFPVGDAVNLSARAGDRLHLVRTSSGGIGLSLLRQQRLILALGTLRAVPACS
jgi:hypothetical protein